MKNYFCWMKFWKWLKIFESREKFSFYVRIWWMKMDKQKKKWTNLNCIPWFEKTDVDLHTAITVTTLFSTMCHWSKNISFQIRRVKRTPIFQMIKMRNFSQNIHVVCIVCWKRCAFWKGEATNQQQGAPLYFRVNSSSKVKKQMV